MHHTPHYSTFITPQLESWGISDTLAQEHGVLFPSQGLCLFLEPINGDLYLLHDSYKRTRYNLRESVSVVQKD